MQAYHCCFRHVKLILVKTEAAAGGVLVNLLYMSIAATGLSSLQQQQRQNDRNRSYREASLAAELHRPELYQPATGSTSSTTSTS
jgi:hypothetical protein